ncbi:MAG: hypothetical protein NC124_15930 [Clostridium sp.]|nr:hypothetical protein [Clostridium sp.]
MAINVNNGNGALAAYQYVDRAQKASTKGTTFAEKVAEKNIASQSVSETGNASTVSTKDMTMEEYKQYIYGKISQMTINPSRMQDTISINISEAGFEAMKNDPEYEEWVLDYLQKDFNCYNPWTASCGGCYCVKYIGATKEEYHGESWYAGYQNGKGTSLYDEKSQDSFWERRAERKRRLEEQYEEIQEKKALAKRLAQGQYYEELMTRKTENSQLQQQMIEHKYYQSSIAKETVSAAYEANVLSESVESSNFDSTVTGIIA